MKKYAILILALAMVLVMTTAPVLAGKGAVKVDLTSNGNVDSIVAWETVVGSVVLNTTANGMLIAVVNISHPGIANMDDAVVRVSIRSTPCTSQYNDETGRLSTNGQGQGNATVKVPIPDFSACATMPTEIEVMVWVDWGNSPMYTLLDGNATVPLK